MSRRHLPALLIAITLIGCVPQTPPPTVTSMFDALTNTPAPAPTLDATGVIAATLPPTAVLNVTATITPTPDPFNVDLTAFPVPTEHVIYVQDADIRAVAPDGTADRRLLTHPNAAAPVRSPGGRWLAFTMNKPYVLDLTTGALTVLDPQEESALASFFWLSDEVLYYVWQSSGAAWSAWRTTMSAPHERESVLALPEGTVMMHVPDDERIIISEPVDNQRQTVVLNWRTGERVLMQGAYQLTALSRDHTRAILYGPGDGREGGYVAGFYITGVDLRTGEYFNSIRVAPSNGAAGYDYPTVFSPDGDYVLTQRLFTRGFGSEVVVISYDSDSFFESVLTPGPGLTCYTAAWYSALEVIATCRPFGVTDTPGELWRVPIDGGTPILLAERGAPVMTP